MIILYGRTFNVEHQRIKYCKNSFVSNFAILICKYFLKYVEIKKTARGPNPAGQKNSARAGHGPARPGPARNFAGRARPAPTSTSHASVHFKGALVIAGGDKKSLKECHDKATPALATKVPFLSREASSARIRRGHGKKQALTECIKHSKPLAFHYFAIYNNSNSN